MKKTKKSTKKTKKESVYTFKCYDCDGRGCHTCSGTGYVTVVEYI